MGPTSREDRNRGGNDSVEYCTGAGSAFLGVTVTSNSATIGLDSAGHVYRE